MRDKLLIMSIAAATLLASPAFAGPPLTQSAQVESIDGERVITEAVVNGRLIDAESDAAPANELRLVPNWLDESLDRYVNNIAGRLHCHTAHHFFHGGGVLGQEGGFCTDIGDRRRANLRVYPPRPQSTDQAVGPGDHRDPATGDCGDAPRCRSAAAAPTLPPRRTVARSGSR